MNDVLKKHFEWYEANLDSLLRDYRGKYIAFSGNGVIGAYDNQIEGVQGAIDLGHPLGTFDVHLCVPKSEEKPLIFNSRRMGFVIPKATVTESDLTDCDALIGMDIITLGDMIVSNNPNTRFSFRIPSEGVAGLISAHEVVS